MRALFLALLLLLTFGTASAQAAMSPATADYLRTIGIDPDSADVRNVADDAVTNDAGTFVDLNSLAANRVSNAEMRKFISTRNFPHKILKNPNTPFPPVEEYDAVKYMTRAERIRVGTILVDGVDFDDEEG